MESTLRTCDLAAMPRVSISLQISPVTSIGMQQNGIPLISELRVKNDGDAAYEDAALVFSFRPAFALPGRSVPVSIPANGEAVLRNVAVQLDADFFAALTEREMGTVRIACMWKGEELGCAEAEVRVLAFDECYGFHFTPELLAGFVEPNHPDVAKLLLCASGLLEKWTGSPSLDAYQSGDANRVRNQVAAIYGAIQQLNVTYAVPPASFEKNGQRVRTPDVILRDHLATCLDLTLLFASCLEAAGLHAILIVVKGHSFAGAWLEEKTFPETVQDDLSLITKRAAQGINEICLVETTCACAGKSTDFEDAERAALQNLNTMPFEFLVDIRRARTAKILPLPRRVWTESGFRIIHEERDGAGLTIRPGEMGEAIRLDERAQDAPRTKIDQWLRRLLDLSKRNALINLRLTRSMLPVMVHRLDLLEDAMVSGEDFRLLPKSAEWGGNLGEAALFEGTAAPAAAQALELDFANRNLRIPYAEGEVQKSVVQLYRASRVSMEENGANTLYLALGALKWYETPGGARPRYAPIVLLPVDLVRKSAQTGYVIRLRDEEPQMNITLLEFLKQDFQIQVTGLDPLPQDERGLDIRKILSIMRRHVMHIPRWDVVEGAFLGIFSFAQFVMWNDLKNRVDELAKNKVVKSLIDGRLAFEPADMARFPLKESGALLPIPADGSQLKAVEAASEGVSFVLHGPPGTGKSQTITNMIANALAQGRTVLFAAEKMAALEVVKRRLEEIGLGPFCLEMHSNKSRKKDVLDQLEKALAARPAEAGNYALTTKETEAVRGELERHVRRMHASFPLGMSLYEAIDGYQRYAAAPEGIVTPQKDVPALTPEARVRRERLVDELVAAGKLVGHPKDHPLQGIGVRDYTQQLRGQAEAALSDYDEGLGALDAARGAFAACVGAPENPTLGEAARLTSWARAAQALEDVPVSWRAVPGIEAHFPALVVYCAHAYERARLRGTLLSEMDEAFLREDGEALKRRWRAVAQQWALPRVFSRSKLIKALAGFFKGGKLDREKAELLILGLSEYQKECAALEETAAKLPAELIENEAVVPNRLEAARRATAALNDACGDAAERLRISAGRAPGMLSAGRALVSAWETHRANAAALDAVLQIEPGTFREDQSTDARRAQTEKWRQNLSLLRDYSAWLSTAERARAAGLSPVVDAYRAGMAHEDVKGAYLRGLYRAVAEWLFARDPEANAFNGMLFAEKVARFRKLDEELTALTRREIVHRLSARIPDRSVLAAQSSELGILQRAIRSGGRGVAIRRLMGQLPALLPLLCPCMLMSPLSAAQYLDPARKPFDLVVFDEASQLPTCEAVGVLARGETAVVVGDPKQMPPTSFFAASSEDEENPELEDLECILDDCLALSMPETHLKWHYRSRHESLIAFSNREYYDNALYTFPSPNALVSKVRHVAVDGYYDRGRTRQNRAEAEAVVAEVAQRLRTREHPSIGIVTFSAAQQNLIDDLVQELFAKEPALEDNALRQGEPLFIKNLENVQGDERDAILFSVGYGPDAAGRVAMNFGPLNREGGERRLNVAVSRARDEMVVFSTLRPDQLDMSRTRARGVAGLKSFLEFAMRGVGREPGAQSPDVRDGLAESVAEALSRAGHRTHLGVGFSKFKVDVAIVDPEDESRYLLGVLLDGPSYKAAETVRDREISQSGVLSRLGWRLVRVYAIDWWEDPARETKRILAALDVPDEKPAPPPAPVAAARPAAESKPVRDDAQRKYVLTGLPDTPKTADEFVAHPPAAEIVRRLTKIVRTEGPIVESLLVRRLLNSFGIARSGTRIQALLRRYLRIVPGAKVSQGEETVYFPQDAEPACYAFYRPGEGETRRDAAELPWTEVANAAKAVLRAQFGLSRDDLIRETAKLFGYARLGTNVVRAMEAGIDLLIADGEARQNEDGGIYLN